MRNDTVKPNWMKTKGYLHLSPSLRINENWKSYQKKIQDPSFIQKYAFYPLMHSIIKERKYKKVNSEKHLNEKERTHNFKLNDFKFEKTAKKRPLHYATHFDALIYGYYASILNELYEAELKRDLELDGCVNAYRKIILEDTGKGKSTIHFAKDVFDEIKNRSGDQEEVGVLTFDIESFFSSLDHQLLEKKWSDLLNEEQLPPDHKNVFKSCTKFSYVLRDDLRIRVQKSGKRSCFNEKKLAKIRREKGFKSFFESNADFRDTIKQGKLRIYKNSFYRQIGEEKIQAGIPQGLPISAVLANLYLLDFDKHIIDTVVKDKGGFYRRYSDDIIIVANVDDLREIKNYIENLIKESNLKISSSKTESFIFRKSIYNQEQKSRLTSFKQVEGNERKDAPLIYLGFEFRGYNTCVKSTNIAKFYRRLISIVRRRSNRAKRNKNPNIQKAVFKNQIKKLYKKPLRDLDGENGEIKQTFRNRTFLVENERNEFSMIVKPSVNKNKSNYFSYIKRCEKIFDSKIFSKQLRKKEHLLNTAIAKHLNK